MAGRNEEVKDLEESVKDVEINTKERSDSNTVFTSPKCLIEADSGGFKVNRTTLRQIATVEKKLVVIAIVGLYRTGKSYLLTRLAGKYSGFSLGHATEAMTKGIWAWCLEHPVYGDRQLLLLDTEGLGDIKRGDGSHDNKIFTMATLLSSTLIYNDKNAFNEDTLKKLSFIVHFAKNVKATNDEDGEDGGQLDIYLPDFILVLRDFYLKMESDGRKLTPDEYLEKCLEVKKGDSEQEKNLSSFNETRLRLRRFFKNRKCFTIGQPGLGDVLTSLETMTDEDLDKTFVRDVHHFLNYVKKEAKTFRTRNETPINGSMFAALVDTYADAFQRDGVPCIDTAFKAMAEKENQKAIAKIFDDYKKNMENLELPTKDELDFSIAHRTHKEVADAKYLEMIIMDEKLKFKEMLLKKIHEYFTELRDKNKELSSIACQAKLTELYEPISQKVKSGRYSCEGGYEAYQSDLLKAKKNYYSSESIGFMKDPIFLKFLEDIEVEKQKILWADMQLKEAVKQQKVAEEADRIAAEQERLKKLEEEKMEREKRKEAELKAQEKDNLMKKMQEDMEKEKRKTEEALRKKEEECKRLEAEGLRKEADHERKEKEIMKQYLDEKVNSWGNWFYQKAVGWLF